MGGRAVEHVDVDVCDRAEGSAFDEDGFAVKNFGGLEHVTAWTEHDGVGEAEFDEHERHEAVIHVMKRGAVQFQHIDFDAVGGEVIEE